MYTFYVHILPVFHKQFTYMCFTHFTHMLLGEGKSEADGLAVLEQLAEPGWSLDTRLVQSYAYNDVIRAATASDDSLGGFLEAMRTKQAKGAFVSLADPSLWPALMTGAISFSLPSAPHFSVCVTTRRPCNAA